MSYDEEPIYCQCPICDSYVPAIPDEYFGDLMLVEHETPDELIGRLPIEIFAEGKFQERQLVIENGHCEGSYKSVDDFNAE